MALMSKNKQNSIELLFQDMFELTTATIPEGQTRYELMKNAFEQAKAMHKEEIIEAFDEGQEYEYQYHINSTPKFDSETYYNDTFTK
jgi:hypothetical protein